MNFKTVSIKTYKNEVINLWKHSFGDTDEEILFFLNKCKNYECVGYFDKSVLVSMLFLVDCKIDDNNYKYIYAACTDENYRRKGAMTNLLNFCKTQYNKFVLIPGNDNLVDYYSSRGFKNFCTVDKLIFNQFNEIKEYLLDGYNLTCPKTMICEVG